MPNEHITNAICHNLREELYKAIFPRWALLFVILLIASLIGTLYTLTGKATVAAANAQKKAENNETKFTLEIGYTNKGVARIEKELGEQRKLLIAIDKKIPDTR